MAKTRPRNFKKMRRIVRKSMALRKVLNTTKGPHRFIRTMGSESMSIVSTGVSAGGTISLSNQGFLTLTTSALLQGTQYFTWSPVFIMQDCPDSSEFTALFDRYRVKSVSLKFLPIANVAAYQLSTAATPSNGAVSGYIHSVTDYDDSATFLASAAGVNDMRQYETYKTKRIFSTQTYSVRPKLAMSVYQGAFTGYAQSRNIWVDCNTSAQYYGKKFLFEIFNPSLTTYYINFKVEIKYNLEFRDVR